MDKLLPMPQTAMLWRGIGAASHVSLIGSIHMLDCQVPAWVLSAYADANVVVFETNTNAIEAAEAAFPVAPDGISLSRRLQPETLHDLRTVAVSLGLNFEEDLDMLLPSAAALRVMAAAARHELSLPGIDLVIRAKAQADHKQFAYLESPAEFRQLVYFETPLNEQERSLVLALRRVPHLRRALSGMSAAWHRGDLEGVSAALDIPRMMAECPGIAAALYRKRTRLWAPPARRASLPGRPSSGSRR
jgi:uncharacterized protein YbaP (TraB family)